MFLNLANHLIKIDEIVSVFFNFETRGGGYNPLPGKPHYGVGTVVISLRQCNCALLLLLGKVPYLPSQSNL
jgi:hypothetical protein